MPRHAMNEVITTRGGGQEVGPENRREEYHGFAHQHGHLAACTIFRPLGKTGPRKQRVIHHEGGKGSRNPYKLKIVCPWELDTDDESVLLVMISMVSTLGRIQQIKPGHSCRVKLQETGACCENMTAATFTNRHEILQKLGWNREGKSYRRLNDSMERLNHTLINYTPDNGHELQSKLIAVSRYHEKGKEVDNRLLVTLNQLSAAVIFGNCKNGISIHEIHERRLINHSPLALGIYSQCVYFAKPGKTLSRDIQLSTMLRRIYALEGNEQPTPKQRELVRGCIESWKIPGWKVSITGRGDAAMVHIFRPKSTQKPTHKFAVDGQTQLLLLPDPSPGR